MPKKNEEICLFQESLEQADRKLRTSHEKFKAEIADRNEAIVMLQGALRNRDRQIADLSKERASLKADLQEASETAERDTYIKDLEQTIDALRKQHPSKPIVVEDTSEPSQDPLSKPEINLTPLLPPIERPDLMTSRLDQAIYEARANYRLACDFIRVFKEVQDVHFCISVANGWWDDPSHLGQEIAGIHSELSEAYEGSRHGLVFDDMLTHMPNIAVEMADCILRIMSSAQRRHIPVAEALIDKLKYNTTRGRKHGKNY